MELMNVQEEKEEENDFYHESEQISKDIENK